MLYAYLVISFLAALVIPPLPQPDQGGAFFASGSLSRYAPGVMERVNEWRHINGIPSGFDPYAKEYDGYIAVMDCHMVGETVTAHLMIDREWSGPYEFYVSDCTESEATKRWMTDNRIPAELDYATWDQLGIVDGRGAWIEITQ